MEYRQHENTHLGSLTIIYIIAVVLQVLSLGSVCSGITCQYCDNVPSLEECDSTRECASNEICRTEIRIHSLTSTTYRMDCQQDQACLNEQGIYEPQCTGDIGSVCVTCCNTDLCNAPSANAGTNQPTTADATTTQGTIAVPEPATTVTETATTDVTTTQPPTTLTARSSSTHLSSSLYKLYSSARKIKPQHVLSTSEPGSVITCAMTCAHTPSCRSFGYNNEDGLCYTVGSPSDELTFSIAEKCNHYILEI
nr:threonine-rich protein-like [Lytechinus pictus]